jgi:hypothetical protein
MARPKSQFCKYGHDTSICGRDSTNACNDCKRNWTLENKDYFKNYQIEYRDSILAQRKEFRNKNKEFIALKEKEWNDAHKERGVEIDRKSYERHKPKRLAANIKNQTNRNLRVVAWTDWDKIKEVYANCPKGMEVDHIIPLQGKLVSGLHVSSNLQYLTPAENRSKRNKIDL